MSPLHALLLTALQDPAATEAAQDAPSLWFPLLAMGAIFYFLLIAPERKQRKKRQAMLAELKKGDEVLTTGGMLGRVIEVRDERVIVQVADNTRLTFTRQAVQTVVVEEGKEESSRKLEKSGKPEKQGKPEKNEKPAEPKKG